MGLRQLGKKAICVNQEPLMDRYRYLDPEHVVISHQDFMEQSEIPHEHIDLFIVADTNSLARIGDKVKGLVAKSKNLLFIDHHPCPKELAAIHCVDTKMAATGELAAKLLESVGVQFTKEIALALYTSVLIDTSSFRYPTVTGNTHRLIGKLMDAGVEPPMAFNAIYGTKQISYMRMLGEVLSSAQTNEAGEISWIYFTQDLMSKFNVDTEDTHGFVNHLLVLDNLKIGCMFRQDETSVKISFRSTGNIDVGVMAQALGGGGHNHSAATVIDGKLEEIIPDTIKKLELMLANIDNDSDDDN
jgi:phosphoesterase RecJ-like protein